MAIVLVILATPFVAATGTAFHDVRAGVYTDQALHRHSVVVMAVEESTTIARPNWVEFDVMARWYAGGAYHVESVESPGYVRVGERFPIWVDEAGEPAGPPQPIGRAGADAVGVAVLLWLGVVAVAAGGYGVVRHRLNRARHAAWDREFVALTDGGGRRNHRS